MNNFKKIKTCSEDELIALIHNISESAAIWSLQGIREFLEEDIDPNDYSLKEE